MKNHYKTILCFVLFITPFINSYSQSPGYIVRTPSGPGPAVLNPNGDSWTSATNSGYTTSDITQSEIGYKIIPPIIIEPTGDLATGPSGGYSDIVKTLDGSGCYIYYDGTNILFRIRIGSIVSGAKAYNVLFDTDLKLGATGPNADPNYIAATNSGNGNPGFEWEVALETGTNGRVAVYNVDGITNPTASSTYTLSTNHLISVALSRESNDADYFYDFFIPRTALGLSETTPFRIVVTTNTNPGSAFQGTRSDIYGINDALFPNTTEAWEYVGKNTPSFTLINVGPAGSGPGPVCTTAPTVNSGIASGSNVSVSGTWTRLDAGKPSVATITVYKNGASQGTTTCNTGSSWNFVISSIATGDIISAQAQSVGESMCLVSNRVTATNCTPANTSTNSTSAITCFTAKGIQGNKPANAKIKLYTITAGGSLTLLGADDLPSPNTITYPSGQAGTTWEYHSTNNGGPNAACTGGPSDMANGSYAFTVIESGKCESAPSFYCFNLTQTATPTITQTTIFPGSTISGTAVASSTVRLLVNGFIVASTTATGGTYSFTNQSFQTGDVITIRSQSSGECISEVASVVVSCYTSAPTITTDVQGNLTAGVTTVSGRSTEPAGTTIRVYLSPSTLIGTTTVQAGGDWSATVSPALANSSVYFATAQNGSCTVSPNSATATARTSTTACPSITGTYAEGASVVNGTISGPFTGTIFLYQDGAQTGSTSISSASSWSINIAAGNPLYAGGVLTAGAQVSGGTLNRNCASTTTVSCSIPATPVVSPTSITITPGQTVTYTVNSTVSGVLYSIMDAGTGASYTSSKFGNNSNQNFTTTPFNTLGTYNIIVEADKLSGNTCKSSAAATIYVSSTLPVTWVSFTAAKQQQDVLLKWVTGSEINTRHYLVQHSTNSSDWITIGITNAAVNSMTEKEYQFLHTRPADGINYYRLAQVDQDDQTRYSRIVTLLFSKQDGMVIYPNPSTDGKFSIQLPAFSVLRVFNNTGQELKRLTLPAGVHNINLSALHKGIYILQAGDEIRKLIIK